MKKLFTAFAVFFCFIAAHAQVFPYIESFNSYTTNQPLNGDGGIISTSHVYVTPYGITGNCAEFQMTDTAPLKTDTLTSPLIGPLTGHAITSFSYRAVTITGGVPSVYHMAASDMAIIYVGTRLAGNLVYIPQDTISALNQNTTTGYVKAVVAIPGSLSGLSGWFRIVTYNPSGNNWKLEFDSLVVRDTIPVPPVLHATVTNVGCRSQSTGGIRVTATGQNPPFTYLWSVGGDTSQAIIDQPAGIYTVTVTDYFGATASLTDTIRQPALALILDSLTKTPALCYGSNTGSATVYASGGTLPYTYLWSNSPASTSSDAQNLNSGNYTVTVNDAGGCVITATVHISQPSNALITTTQSTQSTLGNNGTATVLAAGGTGTIHYAWSTNPVQTTSVATGLAPGLYEVTVSDGTGCVIVDTVFVAFPAGINELSNHNVSIYPNPATDRLYIDVKGINNSQLAVAVMDLSGRVVIAQEGAADFINTSGLANGVYIIKLSMDGAMCTSRLVIER
jgi:hypothetical protein